MCTHLVFLGPVLQLSRGEDGVEDDPDEVDGASDIKIAIIVYD